jgi:NAD(P)-dependent dehydrogenase (short-subunit alcohol dehydrogenase family)
MADPWRSAGDKAAHERPLSGRVAIVTGAGRGVGRAEAIHLASLGASVIVNDLVSPDEDPAAAVVAEILNAGNQASVNHDDVASMSGAECLVRQAVDVFGRLDILVNNAGILRDRMIFNMSEADWDRVVEVHLRGHFAPTRFATAYWREEAKAGRRVAARIISTSSSAGLFGNAGQANYAAAKAGIAAFAIVVAREMSKYGVTSNVVCPVARTRLLEQAYKAHGIDDERDTDSWDPLDPVNVAELVGFLSGPAAAEISGQVFVVGGGRIQLADGWNVAVEYKQEGPLTGDSLAAVVAHLFDDRPTQPPPFPRTAASESDGR